MSERRTSRPSSRGARRPDTGDEDDRSTRDRSSSRSVPRNDSTRIMQESNVDEDEGYDSGNPPDADATHAGPPVTVEVLEGPDQGRKKRVRGGRMVIGRGDGCDFKLRDTACSRRHLEIIVGMSGSLCRDLGSGNGTKVNGQRVDEAGVGHGDEIQVGTTLLRVIDEIQALEESKNPPAPEPVSEQLAIGDAGTEPPLSAEPAPRAPGTEAVAIPTRARPRNLIVLGAIAGGGLVLIGVMISLLRTPAKPVEPVVDDNKAAKLVADGKQALASGDYDKANADWDELAKVDANYADLPDLRDRTKKEKAAHAQLADAQQLINDHRYDDAKTTLQAIPSDSVVSDQAADLLKSVDAKQVEYLINEGGQKVAAGDLDGARAIAQKIAPMNQAESDKLANAIQSSEDEREKEALKNIKSKKKREAMLKDMKKRKLEEAVRNELAPGYRQFDNAATPGSYERAAAAFERIAENSNNTAARARARELVTKVRNFASAVEQADELEADQNYEAEVGSLDKAVAALQVIDPDAFAMKKLRARLVKGLLIKGQNASARQAYDIAARSFNRVLQLSPNQPDAKAGLQAMRSRAHDVYLQAYEEETRDPEAARKLYQSVMQMQAPGDEWYEKAKQHLAKITGVSSDN